MKHRHSLSHYKLMTGNMGTLYPAACVEVLPGDVLRWRTSALIRLSPLVSPVMHPVQVRVHHWYVPTRLVEPDWESFITGGEDGLDSTVLATIAVPTPVTDGPLLDYLGVPPIAGQAVLAYPVRAFNLIFNTRYRDQDLVTARAEDAITLPNVAWEKDYFTTARPWAEKGPSVTLPLGTTAPVVAPLSDATTTVGVFAEDDAANRQLAPAGGTVVVASTAGPGQALTVDLSAATASSIIDLREASALQRFMENRARYGGRYSEYLRAAFRVAPQDGRLAEPEYLGGGKQTVAFSEVLYTAEGATAPVGTQVGHGIAAIATRRFRRFIPEHGYVLTLVSVRPKTIYGEGLHRKFLRAVKEDYFQQELQFIGAQEVMDQEVWCDGTAPATFGYQERYREYKEEPSGVAGEFRQTPYAGVSLDDWHFSREFAMMPTLNSAFVTCTPREDAFADATPHTLRLMVNHHIQALRMVARNAQTGRLL